MTEALALAAEGMGRTSPNPAVGAVVVRDGAVVGRGYHVYSDRKHAEVVALEQAGDRARGSTLYVTLEPCSHQGRTGPCADEVIRAGVARVVAAMEDPNPQVAGSGFERLRQSGVEVEVSSNDTPAALKLNEPYVHFMRTGLPLVTLKTAVTLDGKISAPDDNRGWITSETARSDVQQVRHRADAIVTGIGTVLADDCLLTDRTGQARSRPLLRIILDSQLRLPMHSKIVRSAADDLIVVGTSAASPSRRRQLESAGVRVLAMDNEEGRADVHQLVRWLAREKYLSLLVEAGSKVNWAFLESGATDKIRFYYAPKILGGLQSLPLAGGAGRRRRVDAIQFRDLTVETLPTGEFIVEAWLVK